MNRSQLWKLWPIEAITEIERLEAELIRAQEQVNLLKNIANAIYTLGYFDEEHYKLIKYSMSVVNPEGE
jgi:hypothetical protein